MEHKDHIEQFDGFFKDRMEGFEPQAPANLWSDIDQATQIAGNTAGAAGKSLLTIIMKAAAILLPAAAIGWYALSSSQDKNQPASPPAKETTPYIIPKQELPLTEAAKPEGSEALPETSIPESQEKTDKANPTKTAKEKAIGEEIAPKERHTASKGGAGVVPSKEPVTKDGGLASGSSSASKAGTSSPQAGVKNPEEVKFQPLKTEVCLGETVQFTNLSPAGFENFQWDFDDDRTFNQALKENATHTFREPGVYNVTLTAFKGKRSSDFTVRIRVVLVQAYFTVDQSNAPRLQFVNASHKAQKYSWDFGDHSSLSPQPSPEHQFRLAETVTVRLIASNGSCADTFQMDLNPSEKNTKADLLIPNVITPNGDGINDVWRVRAENVNNYSLIITDKNGHKIFESANIQEGWNGICADGKYCPPGDYFYFVQISQGGKEAVNKGGPIKLIR